VGLAERSGGGILTQSCSAGESVFVQRRVHDANDGKSEENERSGGERSERALRKTRILAIINPAKSDPLNSLVLLGADRIGGFQLGN